jgi:hypothetical protein
MIQISQKNYFTRDTEEAIIEYNKAEQNSILREKLYSEKIHYPFFKLTQNIIHTFKFYHTEEVNIEDLQHEIEIFLLSKLPLYSHAKNLEDRFKKVITKEFKEFYDSNFIEFVNNKDRVTQEDINNYINILIVSDICKEKLYKFTPPKAYSYFGTIVKRWLIIYNKNNYSKKISKVPITNLKENQEVENKLVSNEIKDENLSKFMDEYVKYCTENIFKLFPSKNDAQVADVILELFRNREVLEEMMDGKWNKKALYIYIREMIDVKTPKITSIADNLYGIFKKNYVFYLENGYMKFR